MHNRMDSLRDKKLFEIPIYRCSPATYLKEEEKRKAYYRALHEGIHPDKEFSYIQWRSFKYNEIVGWIVITGNGHRVRAEYWLVRERISKLLIRKTFAGKGKLFQFRIRNRQMTAAEIFQGILKLLRTVSKEWPLIKFWLDVECFENVGSLLNWQEVLGLNLISETLTPEK